MRREFDLKGGIWTPSRRDFLKSAGIVLAGGLVAPKPARATGWTFLGGVNQYGVNTSTGTIDTSTANLIVVALATNGGGTPSTAITDSLGNTWLTALAGTTIYCGYCVPASKGAGHTFKINATSSMDSQCSIMVAAFSFATTPLLTASNSNHQFGSSVLTRQVPSITPSANNALYIAAGQIPVLSALAALDSSLSYATRMAGNGAQFGGALGYIDQSSAAAIAPTLTGTSVTQWMDVCGFYFLGSTASAITRRFIGMGRE